MYHIYFVLPNPGVSTTSIYVKGARSEPQNVNLLQKFLQICNTFQLELCPSMFQRKCWFTWFSKTACTTICRRYREKKSKKIYQPIQNETFSFCHIEEKINLCSKLCDLHWRRVTILLRSASASLYFAILPISLLCSDLLNRCNHWG